MASLRPMLEQLASEAGLQLEPGRFVLELRPRGLDKGGALTALVAERGARAVLFAGDDLGDLAAFAAVDELRRQGVQGVTVWSASPEVPALAERADVVVNGPEGVVALLEALAGTG
jgi:trehalose 6-phosphate phosphatase